MNVYKICTEKDGKTDIDYVASASLVTALSYSGVYAKDKAQAVRWIDQLLRKGQEYSSALGTTTVNGECPGHEGLPEDEEDKVQASQYEAEERDA